MQDETGFDAGLDMEAYIDKRMLEIADLQERVAYKEIVGSMIKRVYDYARTSYQELERKILAECSSDRSDYAVYMTLTDQAHYDPTDPFMHPVLEDSVTEKKILCGDVVKALREKTPLKLYTVFLQVRASQICRLLSRQRIFSGIVRTGGREYRAEFILKRNEAYLEKIEELYYIFEANCQSWTTVCGAYLMKLLDVYLYSAADLPEDMGKADKDMEIDEIKVDLAEFAESVVYDVVPLWNLEEHSQETSIYPEPCIDKTNYEHRIFSHMLEPGCAYLVMDTGAEITNIRRLDGDLIITCPVEKPVEWRLYRVSWPDPGRYQNRYAYPVLSNGCKESFTADITEMYRRSIKTKAEMARLIESYPYTDRIAFVDHRLTDREPEGWRDSNYNMDGFVEDEIRTGDGRWFLIVRFRAQDHEDYLNEDIMSFLVTQVQKIFPEYKCIGELI